MEKQLVTTAFSIGFPPMELNNARLSEDGTLPISAEMAGGEGRVLDANIWLPKAAEYYKLSANIKDYVLVAVPSMVTDIPNTNGDSVSLRDLTAFNPEQGHLAYKTWAGKPMYVEHQHKPEWIRGIIFDSYMRPIKRFPGYYKLVKLAALDRTRDPALVNRVISRELNTYSMGMYFTAYTCSICGHTAGKGVGAPCSHTRPRKPTYRLADGRLCYRICHNITGFELSLLTNLGGRSGSKGYRQGYGDPSYVSAIGDIILDPTKVR